MHSFAHKFSIISYYDILVVVVSPFCVNIIITTGTDDEQVVLSAFAQYDDGNGTCDEDM